MRNGKLLLAACVLGVTVSIIAAFALGELTIRVVHLVRDGIPFTETPSGRVGAIVLDPRLGWRATDWYAQDLTETTAEGVAYAVHRSQGAYGFRQYGDVRSAQTRFWSLGIPSPKHQPSQMIRPITHSSNSSWGSRSLRMVPGDMAPCRN